MWEFIFVGLGASVGAMGRYGLSQFMNRILHTKFPLATFLTNISGSFLLGLLFAMHFSDSIYHGLGVGVLGGYTTFSTFNFELLSLLQRQDHRRFMLYFAGSFCGGLASSFLGILLGTWLHQ